MAKKFENESDTAVGNERKGGSLAARNNDDGNDRLKRDAKESERVKVGK